MSSRIYVRRPILAIFKRCGQNKFSLANCPTIWSSSTSCKRIVWSVTECDIDAITADIDCIAYIILQCSRTMYFTQGDTICPIRGHLEYVFLLCICQRGGEIFNLDRSHALVSRIVRVCSPTTRHLKSHCQCSLVDGVAETCLSADDTTIWNDFNCHTICSSICGFSCLPLAFAFVIFVIIKESCLVSCIAWDLNSCGVTINFGIYGCPYCLAGVNVKTCVALVNICTEAHAESDLVADRSACCAVNWCWWTDKWSLNGCSANSSLWC